MLIVTSAAVTALLALFVAAGQSPAEVAEKERKRREAAGEKARVFTNDDLESRDAEADSDEAADAEDAAGSREEARRRAGRDRELDAEARERRNDEIRWRSRADAIRRQLAQAKARLEAARDRVEELAVDTKPQAGVTDPFREQKLEAARLAAGDEYDAAQDAIDAAEDGFVELEEEARRARVPPGWLREK